MRHINTKGFTIIELLIATVVFSLVLLILTATIIQFNNIYYKGVVSTKTQETTRSIAENITRNIQFAGGSSTVSQTPTAPNAGYLCAGDYVYKYVTGQLVENGPVLLRYKSICMPNPGGNGTELIGSNMFLQNITLSATNPYTLSLSIGYGAIGDHNADGSCRYSVRLGGSFCGFNKLNVTVSRRLGL
jgi:prepilin-type N-terminal cleavage/methylation domain-containing protein